MNFYVTEKSTRPAQRVKDRCFYCGQRIGELHSDDCVVIVKKVRIRMIVEYEISVPSLWDKEMIEFYRNESSWCASNAIEELDSLFGFGGEEEGNIRSVDSCMCEVARFEYIEDVKDSISMEE